MGTFFVKCRIENPANRTRAVVLQKLLVDTGSECTWAPEKSLEKIGVAREKDVRFVLANGQEISRRVGFAIVRLEIDSARRRLLDAGPLPAAAPHRPRR